MISRQSIRGYVLAAVAALFAGLITTAPIAPNAAPLPAADGSAIQLLAAADAVTSGIPTADPDFTFAPGDLFGFGQISADITEVNDLIARFEDYVPEVMNQQMASLNDIFSSSLSNLDLSQLGAEFNTLYADAHDWFHGFTTQVWAFAESMDTQPDGELVPSFCNILNVIGVDMDDWWSGMSNGMSGIFQDMTDGMNGILAGFDGL